VNFGTLAYFKYTNFGLDSAGAALGLLGLHVEMPRVDVVLPIGISFHVFQSFAYVMDVLYGRTPPCRNFVHYALYVSWFPQLVAGPIERPGHLLPQLVAVDEGKADFASRLPHAALPVLKQRRRLESAPQGSRGGPWPVEGGPVNRRRPVPTSSFHRGSRSHDLHVVQPTAAGSGRRTVLGSRDGRPRCVIRSWSAAVP
jgi:hypothetical protein